MAFEVEHDWQAHLATPRPRIGENAKTRLLLLLCALWICLGLVGHDPWKPYEPQTISIVKGIVHGGSWVIPAVAGVASLPNPPLYYLSAAAIAKLLSPWLPLHDAARIVTGLWMALTLLMVGLTGRELWGKGSGRQTTFIFLGSLGMVVAAHALTPEVAGLTGCAMGMYSLALARRRPLRAGVLLGSGIGISFLATGPLTAEIIAATAIVLPILFGNWRSKRYSITLGIALLAASPWLVIWPILCWQAAPDLFLTWWHQGRHVLDNTSQIYFLQTLSWYSWPALPLAAWSVWHHRTLLLHKAEFQLLLMLFAVSFLLLGFGADERDILALPLLLPMAALAGGAVEYLRRGAANALDWFGLILFGIMGSFIWLSWVAMMTGTPSRLAARMHKLSEAYIPSFHWMAFAAALTVSIVWLLVAVRNKRSSRAAVTGWALGITMVWGLLMTLWLPWLNANKGYQGMIASMQRALPKHYACVTSLHLASSQRALLDYYADIRTQPFEMVQHMDCDLYLIQDERGHDKINPGSDWKLIWQGKRPSDRHESFRLYRRRVN